MIFSDLWSLVKFIRINTSTIKEGFIIPGNLIPFILITSMFFLWVLANNEAAKRAVEGVK